MKKTIHFSTTIDASREIVWDKMLSPEPYKLWTAEFAEGSYYEGSWEKGEKIRFLSPAGGGMLAVIAENRPQEFVSIKHLGMVTEDGTEDTGSEAVRAWVPAFENYTLSKVGQATRLDVDIEVTPDFEDYMNKTWPKALARLKELCERPGA